MIMTAVVQQSIRTIRVLRFLSLLWTPQDGGDSQRPSTLSPCALWFRLASIQRRLHQEAPERGTHRLKQRHRCQAVLQCHLGHIRSGLKAWWWAQMKQQLL